MDSQRIDKFQKENNKKTRLMINFWLRQLLQQSPR
jgi:hypothetical protein